MCKHIFHKKYIEVTNPFIKESWIDSNNVYLRGLQMHETNLQFILNKPLFVKQSLNDIELDGKTFTSIKMKEEYSILWAALILDVFIVFMVIDIHA